MNELVEVQVLNKIINGEAKKYTFKYVVALSITNGSRWFW